MQVQISGHNVEVTQSLRDYIDGKLKELEGKYGPITVGEVTLTAQGGTQLAQGTVHGVGGAPSAVGQHEVMETAIDLLAQKLDRQLAKLKQKQQGL
ncbi:ribosome hibernation-promoting factor, HPF/YfiA family [Streptomyces olivaceus]|uniref:ribosome hibernation-promoting factor, HPF/YfiA family n=1 Tax=Streptomyces olivaceus TaxID=47716 RepID=UPI0036E4B2A4